MDSPQGAAFYDGLALRAGNDDGDAYSELFSAFLPSIRRLAGIYTVSAADRDDLVSEGILGLMNAVATFEPGRGASFSTYAGRCINNRMLTALKKSAKIKRSEEPLDEIGSKEVSPEKIIIDREALSEIFSEASQTLSPTENRVLGMYIAGADYAEIADRLGIDRKAVDNALSRLRRKLRRKFR